MHERVREEIDLLRTKYPNLKTGENLEWLLIPDYSLPLARFNKERTKLLFVIPPGYPNTAPDNFFVDVDLQLTDGSQPAGFNQGANSSSGKAPIEGDWGWFSWHPNVWRPAAIIEEGDNLVTYLRAVNACLRGEEST